MLFLFSFLFIPNGRIAVIPAVVKRLACGDMGSGALARVTDIVHYVKSLIIGDGAIDEMEAAQRSLNHQHSNGMGNGAYMSIGAMSVIQSTNHQPQEQLPHILSFDNHHNTGHRVFALPPITEMSSDVPLPGNIPLNQFCIWDDVRAIDADEDWHDGKVVGVSVEENGLVYVRVLFMLSKNTRW